MKKITFIFALLCASVMGFAIDWSGYAWIGNGSGNAAYTDKFKMTLADGQAVVNIQSPGFATAPGIYTTLPAGIISCSLPSSAYDVQGAGMILHVDYFTAQETEITVTHGTGTAVFTVYYADGTTGGSGDPDPGTGGGDDPEPAGINWNDYSWIGNGSGNAAYTDKFKMTLATGQAVVNIQSPGFATAPGIYTTLPAGIISCSLPASAYDVQGAGMILHVDYFTYKETEITVTHGTGTAVFTVYYADGIEGSAEPEPEEIYDTNFALVSLGASATSDNGGTANNAIDGNDGSSWESTHGVDAVKLTIDLGQKRIFNTVQIRWEGAYGKAFTIDVSNDGTDWTTVKSVDETLSGFPHEQTLEFAKTTAKYIRFNGIARGTQWGYNMFSFRVLLPGVSELTSIDLTAAGATTALGGAGMVMTATPKDQNGQAMEAAVSYEITPAAAGHMDGNTFIPDLVGNATIRAYNGEIYSNAVVVAVYEGINVALNKGDDKITASGYDTGDNLYPRFAVDDNDGSLWSARVGETGDERVYDAWIAVDLEAYYNINLIAIRWEGACSRHYHVDFSADGTNWRTAYNAGWDAVATHWEYLIGTGEDATKVKYVRVWSTEAVSQYGVKIMALQVYGTEWVDTGDTEAPVMTSANLASCSFHKAVIDVAATDNHEVARFHVVDAANGIDANFAADVNGQAQINLDVNESTEYHLTVTAIDAANNESTGLLVEFTAPAMGNDLALNKPVEASGEDPAWPASNAVIENDALWWSAFTGETGDERIYDAWLSVDLGGFYDINKIRIRWEGACSKHYRVEFSANKTDWRVAYLGGHNAVATHWEEFMDTEEDNTKVRYVRIFSTEAVSQYGIKIMALRVYGVPWVPTGDAENPVMVSAALVSNTHNSAVISVSATDDNEVVKYHVVDAGNSIDAEFVPADGKITVTGLSQQTAYHFTVTAIDAAAKESENNIVVDVTTSAYNTVPTVAAPIPTWPAEQVKSIYSDTYELAPAHTPNYNAPWWSAPAITLADIDGNHYMDYNLANDGMIGWQYDQISVATMEKLHIDIYASAAGTVSVRPITNGDPDEVNNVRKTLNLAANQWNSFDIALTEFPGHDWTKLFQFSIEYWNAGGLTGEHISVDNVYFYRESAYVDSEDPTAFTASLASESYFSVKINAQASDNSGAVIFTVKNGDDFVATQNAASEAATVINVNGLNAGTAYNFNVFVADEAGNTLEPIAIAATTKALPGAAPAPTHNAKAVKSIYSEAYESAIPVGINFNEWWWQSPTVAQEVSLGGNNARYYSGLNTNGSFGITWSGDHKLDASGYQKVHFHIYPANSATIEIYPVIQPEGEFHKVSQELVGGQWNEVVLDYSEKTFAPFNQFGVVYTAALGDFFIDNLYFFKDPEDISFSDTENNTATIEAKDDVFANVTINRTFPNTTEWYTLCLPFDLSDAQLTDVFGAGYTLAELVSSEDRGSLIHLNFDYSPEFKAGKAYLLRPGTGVTSAPTFNGVVIKNVDPEAEASICTHMHFQGTFDYITLNQANQRFVGPENYLYTPDPNGTHMKAFRCYFTIPANAPNNVMGKRAKIVFGPQATTEIENVSEQAAPAKFMMDGVLYIIRDGKTYNAQGMLVK